MVSIALVVIVGDVINAPSGRVSDRTRVLVCRGLLHLSQVSCGVLEFGDGGGELVELFEEATDG